MAKTRDERKAAIAIVDHFTPRFWDQVDGRLGVAKEIRRRYLELKEDVGADSAQKDLLVQRAVFIAVQLESMECVAAETGKLDVGIYGQLSNALLGLLKALGLERRLKQPMDLRAYVKERTA